MNKDIIWITKNHKRIPIKATNKFMNDFIRKNKNVEVVEDLKSNKDKEKKEFTKKDVNVLRVWDGIRGYELNGIYLLKKTDYYTKQNKWVINETTDEFPTWLYNGVDWVPYHQDDKHTFVNNYKEGMEKLIEIANKKGVDK